jgi:hypothetical protein
MRLFSVKQLIVLSVLVLAISAGAWSQAVKIPVFVFDGAQATDSVTLYFGFDPTATRGIDASLGEYEAPPLPPGFDARWTIASGVGSPFDYRTTPSSAHIDTFKIAIANGDAPSADFGLMWDKAVMNLYFDSLALKVPGGTDAISGDPIAPRIINMRTADSVFIQTAQDNGIKSFTILGRKIIDGVIEIPNVIPTSFRLGNSYPNPFNPSTTIRFDIAKSAMTEVAVYNILGQKVSTLVSQDLKAGSYSTVWNGTSNEGNSVASGVYFVRMSAHSLETGAEQFSALQKVVFMK